jgi:hypothetical protein
MANSVGSVKPIVTDGLVFCVDALDIDSYSSGSTNWNDLVSSNNATLTNGPVHNNNHMTFTEGTDHAVISNLDASDFQGGFTFFCWVRFHSIGTNRIVFGRHIVNERMYIGINGTDVKLGIGDSFVQSGDAHGMSADRWYNICVTREGTSNLYFVDLVQKASTTTNWSGTNSTSLHIASMNNNGVSQELDGDVALIQLYNRALTTSEKTQNFNAHRHRFGV